MSYRVERDADGRPRITVADEPPYVHAAPEVDDGVWLLMAFAVWSMPDIAEVQTALDAARHFDGAVNLGLYPFDDPDEVAAWHPAAAPDAHTPFWALVDGGTVRMAHSGPLSVDELVEAISLR